MRIFNYLIILFFFASCSSGGGSEVALYPKPNETEEVVLYKAKRNFENGLYAASISSWSTLIQGFPGSNYLRLAYLKIGDAHYFSGNYAKAVSAYSDFAKYFPDDEATEYAMIATANSYYSLYKGVDLDQTPIKNAKQVYTQLVKKYPRSPYVPFAKRQLEQIAEFEASHEEYLKGLYQ